MSLISPNFDVKLIIFSQFWPRAFSQNYWKKPWNHTGKQVLTQVKNQKPFSGMQENKGKNKTVAKDKISDIFNHCAWNALLLMSVRKYFSIANDRKTDFYLQVHYFMGLWAKNVEWEKNVSW